MADARLELAALEIRAGDRILVADARLSVRAGECVALVGPSGSGKTLTVRALLGMVNTRPGVTRAELRITADGRTIAPYTDGFDGVRGAILGYLPQDGRAALDPLLRVGRQVADAGGDPDRCLARAGFRDPAAVAGCWPHELSGGMAQRAALAVALARGSRILLADEPTNGLDPTVQSLVLEDLRRQVDAGLGVLLVTHDLRALSGCADRVVCMDGGRVVEDVPIAALLRGEMASEPARRLLDATRRIAGGRLRGAPGGLR